MTWLMQMMHCHMTAWQTYYEPVFLSLQQWATRPQQTNHTWRVEVPVCHQLGVIAILWPLKIDNSMTRNQHSPQESIHTREVPVSSRSRWTNGQKHQELPCTYWSIWFTKEELYWKPLEGWSRINTSFVGWVWSILVAIQHELFS